VAIYKDKKRGTYYFQTRVKKADGGYRQIKRRGFKSSQEARRAEAEAIIEFEDETSANPYFEHVAKEYLEWYKKRRKASSYAKIEGIVRIHLIPFFGNKRIQNIRNRDVSKFHDSIIDSRKLATLQIIHVVLSAIFNYAIKMEYTQKNPARAIGNFEGKPEKRINFWTLDVFKAFMKHVDDFTYYVMFMVLYYSGMRKGEMLALTWGDIDFDNNIINIDKNNYNGKVTTTKTGVTRQIKMPKFVMHLLSRLKDNQNPKMTYVVFGEYKKPLSTTTIDRVFHKYIKQSGVKRIRIHDFRHSHASYLINKGVIISVISKRLGHTDISTTLNTYSHLYPSTEQNAVDDMESDFKRADILRIKSK
jgi:integrase